MAAETTPMMAQYLEIKGGHKDALLFYRMGDFYEMFFEDAVAAAEALDIALTKRGKHAGQDIAMCGVPAHAAEGYLLTLIRKGFRVAICEQMEDPAEAKKRGSKAVVRREVVRLVTPGTLTEDALLEPRQHNYLAAWSEIRGDGALAWADISTGAFSVMPCAAVRLGPELARLQPAEVLVRDGIDPPQVLGEMDAVTAMAGASFDSAGAELRLKALYGVETLEGFGAFGRAELSAMGAVVDYLELTQKGNLPRLAIPVRTEQGAIMQIDAATRRNLELTAALSGGRAGSLLATIDRTMTAAGGRLLEQRLASPLTRRMAINERLDAVAHWLAEAEARRDLQTALRTVPDLDRALSRLAIGRGGPRDLTAIRAGLEAARAINAQLPKDLPSLLLQACAALAGHDALRDLLGAALVAEPPLLMRDGGFVAEGYDAELDGARQLRDEGRGVVAGLQQSYGDEAGIAALKIKHNNVLGYFIETPATHAKKMLAPPLSDRFIHRQTTANAVRFTTTELSALETRILNAGGLAQEIEARIFAELSQACLDAHAAIGGVAKALTELDLAAGLATLAEELNWTRPEIDESRRFEISGGRHPVVEAALRRAGQPFIANDCALSAEGEAAAITLLTGPNMAGKSTWLRQNALIAILAQMGSFVPSSSAKMGLVSQVFSRVGASDDLARGQSTFMVEMVETAAILNQADSRALVILDEIGRGTATYDGLSIAWAVLEHLHSVNCCRALFATHYHELTQLSHRLQEVSNATVAVREWEGDVVFLHEVLPGAADGSYGVQVAKLAGLPQSVVTRAKSVLEALERGEREGQQDRRAIVDDLPLFSATIAAPPPAKSSDLEDKLRGIDPDTLSPREALQMLYELRAELPD
ncbi:MAG: DNA mismatch repair protein MutS [Pseudomonadota bacterium]